MNHDGIREYISYYSTTDEKYYYLKDHLGSIKVRVDKDGDVVGYDDYYPFGMQMNLRCSSTGNDERFKFTGKERDVATGLDYFGARYYDSKIGRWTSVDPLADYYPSWSPYNYVLNNPVNLIDIFGLTPSNDGDDYLDRGYTLPDVVVTGSSDEYSDFGIFNQMQNYFVYNLGPDGQNDNNNVSLSYVTGLVVGAGQSLKGKGFWVGETKKGMVKLYNFDRFYGNQNTKNLKLFKKLGIFGFFINTTADGIKLINDPNFANQFFKNTGLGISSLIVPEIGAGFLLWGTAEILLDLNSEFWQSSNGQWIIEGLNEMSDPQNYSPMPYNP